MMATKYTYSFKSAVGTFWIWQERDKSWSLNIGDDIIEALGYYDDAIDAADCVFMKATGWEEWDNRARNDAPVSLGGWTKRAVR